jgi:mRNA interferase MazF
MRALENMEPGKARILGEWGFDYRPANLKSAAPDSLHTAIGVIGADFRGGENYMDKFTMRGNLYYADLRPVIGSEQGGIRPVLVIQNNMNNRHSPTVIVAAVTGKVADKGSSPTHCALGTASGLEKKSVVLLEQIRTIDKRRLRDFIGAALPEEMREVDRALAASVGLDGRA